jgi:hypothetical protein
MLPLVYDKEISGYNLELTRILLHKSTILLAKDKGRSLKMAPTAHIKSKFNSRTYTQNAILYAQCTDAETVNTSHVTSKRRISDLSQFHYDTISATAVRDTRQGGSVMWQLVAAKMPLLLTKHSTPTNTRRVNSSLRAEAH